MFHNLASHDLETILKFVDIFSLLKVFHCRTLTVKQVQFMNLTCDEDTILQDPKGLEIFISRKDLFSGTLDDGLRIVDQGGTRTSSLLKNPVPLQL